VAFYGEAVFSSVDFSWFAFFSIFHFVVFNTFWFADFGSFTRQSAGAGRRGIFSFAAGFFVGTFQPAAVKLTGIFSRKVWLVLGRLR
jgi:hypothetical protein